MAFRFFAFAALHVAVAKLTLCAPKPASRSSIAHLKSRAVFGSGLAVVIDAGGGDVGVS